MIQILVIEDILIYYTLFLCLLITVILLINKWLVVKKNVRIINSNSTVFDKTSARQNLKRYSNGQREAILIGILACLRVMYVCVENDKLLKETELSTLITRILLIIPALLIIPLATGYDFKWLNISKKIK